jgi:HK97 family phage major capsid protein
MDWKDKLAESRKLFDEVKEILGNPEASAEDKAKVEPMLEDAKRLKAEAMQLKDILDAAIEMEALDKAEAEKEKESQEEPETKDGAGPSGFKVQARETKGSRFDDVGEFLYACWMAYIGQKRDDRLAFFKEEAPSGHEKKQMVESVGASGGFLVPTEYLAQLQAVTPEDAIVRPRASIIRMRRRSIDIPVLDQTATGTSGQPGWFGGMIFYWAEEATEKTLTDADFKKVTLTAHKLIGYTRASDELLDDAAISLSDFISGPLGFAGGVNWNEDYAFLRGTGAGQPLGIINAGATITVNRQSVANPVQYADLVNMLENFLPSARGVWVVNQSVMSNLLTMMDQAGGAANTGTYIWGSAADGVPNRLLGQPIIFTEKLPSVGNAGDVLLADFRYYLVGDRQATTVESTKFDKWAYDQTSWRVVHRVEGQPWLSTYLTYQDQTITVSPFVMLGDKST